MTQLCPFISPPADYAMGPLSTQHPRAAATAALIAPAKCGGSGFGSDAASSAGGSSAQQVLPDGKKPPLASALPRMRVVLILSK
jgi:hypothetical protein